MMHVTRIPLPDTITRFLTVLLVVTVAAAPAEAQSLVSERGGEGDFALVADGRAAAVWFDPSDHTVVGIAARDFAADVARVTGVEPAVVNTPDGVGREAVIAGSLGRSELVDRLVREDKLDVGGIEGEWESFLIATVEDPLPNVDRALVVVGSDRRGTAYGLYELSRQVGVSPWYWWADVPPRQREALYVGAGAVQEGPPSVKYRGIFINDEDWGLQPWAAMNFDPEAGDIGPKTYARVFELMLRLRANTLWPAMHEVTRAFNLFPENKRVADDYAIVMSSSHAEPMLRNNTTEWTAPPREFNYVTNREGVLAYWEQRARENAQYENLWTVGMRGIHDSPMVGAETMEERVAVMEQIFADQRALLAEYVDPDVERVPQAFTPYKEGLPLYRAGLDVPDDVAIIWPDDNYGYIREFPAAERRDRSGGFGVYYHISYLGWPQSYLWINTTPPALIWQEMAKAYDLGARSVWILNVGDIKPGEIGMSLFLEMAWDINRWRRDTIDGFLADWAGRQFGPEHAPEIAAILADYYQLAFQRKPEHLHWSHDLTWDHPHPLTDAEMWSRLRTYDDLMERVDRIESQLAADQRDAFFELVAYPVRGAALYNHRFFYTTEYGRHFHPDVQRARSYAARARAAQARLARETHRFNHEIAGGKWRRFMAVEPGDGTLSPLRLSLPTLPAANQVPDGDLLPDPVLEPEEAYTGLEAPAGPGSRFAATDGYASMEAESYTRRVDRGDVGWREIPGLGRTGHSVAPFPTTAASSDTTRLLRRAPRLQYDVELPAGPATVHVDVVPTFPIVQGRGLRFAVGLNDEAPQIVVLHREAETDDWAAEVQDNRAIATVDLDVPTAGMHQLRVYMIDAGVVLDKILLDMGGLERSYLGPRETLSAETP